MVNIVVVCVSCVKIHGVLHVHILIWVAAMCLFSIHTEVICQYTVFTTILW